MIISKSIQAALNDQINAEMYSSYLYLAMAAYFDGMNLPGFAAWMKVQAKEEEGHAMKFYGFIVERGGRVTLKGIAEPPAAWKSPLDAFAAAYKHEQHITDRINKLVDLAEKQKDPATSVLLHWFINEQVEEENNALTIVEQLKMIKESTGALFMLDHRLGKRGKE
jgi:ferritin